MTNDTRRSASCVRCGAAFTPGARFCAQCAAPVEISVAPDIRAASDDQQDGVNWMAREMDLADVSATDRARYDRVVNGGIGCVVAPLFVVFGLIALIPTIPLLALFGLPLAIIMFVLVLTGALNIRERLRRIPFVGRLPGLRAASMLAMALSVAGYIAAASAVCILIMRASQKA